MWFESALTYALLSAGMFYLGSRALITRWLWSRYPPKVAAFFDCAACSGFWYGAILTLGLRLPMGTEIPMGTGILGSFLYPPLIVGMMSMVWTPIVAALMHTAITALGDATQPPADDGHGE